MDLSKLLNQLRTELALLDAAIFRLERLDAKGRWRGRLHEVRAGLRKGERKPLPEGQRKGRHSHNIE